jgi:hypothetical protein
LVLLLADCCSSVKFSLLPAELLLPALILVPTGWCFGVLAAEFNSVVLVLVARPTLQSTVVFPVSGCRSPPANSLLVGTLFSTDFFSGRTASGLRLTPSRSVSHVRPVSSSCSRPSTQAKIVSVSDFIRACLGSAKESPWSGQLLAL